MPGKTGDVHVTLSNEVQCSIFVFQSSLVTFINLFFSFVQMDDVVILADADLFLVSTFCLSLSTSENVVLTCILGGGKACHGDVGAILQGLVRRVSLQG